jgi:hypothetical protein
LNQRRWLTGSAALGLGTSGLLALWLDDAHGEGTILLAYPLGFLPVLIASRGVLRRLAERSDWRMTNVVSIAGVHAMAHAALQYAYEPSVTGAPNGFFLPLWLASFVFLWWDARERRRQLGQVS